MKRVLIMAVLLAGCRSEPLPESEAQAYKNAQLGSSLKSVGLGSRRGTYATQQENRAAYAQVYERRVEANRDAQGKLSKEAIGQAREESETIWQAQSRNRNQ